MDASLLPDHGVVFVVGIVGVSQFAIGPEFEFQKFVAEFSLVPDVVAKIEIALHRFVVMRKISFLQKYNCFKMSKLSENIEH